MDLNDLRRLTADLPSMIARATAFAEQSTSAEYQVSSPEGEVAVRVSGSKELLEIRISPEAKRRVDNLTLGELVTATVRAAEQAADDAREEFLASVRIGDHTVADLMRDPSSLIPNAPAPRDPR
ncbi:YbaB/EbfC family nucleoid-associated protein [Actinoplanes sp. NPDC051851]|uniref:YbaB/EbfC family nucleoid-associated protein n=1 Tax=Actinoplanes sp. NPDC051851 TaxID=3154753 RepID=UPI003435A6B2